MKTKLALCVLAASVAISCFATEKYFKWVDADGVTHYTLQEPADQEAQTVQVSSSTPKPVAASAGTKDKADAADDSAAQPPTKSEQTPEEAAEAAEKRQDNCERAKRNMDTLADHERVMIMDEKTGENRYISAEEHAQWKTDSERQVAAFCD